jgi:hypothetical protein
MMINRTGLGLFALGALLFAALFYAATTYSILGWTVNDMGEPALDPAILVALYTIAFGLPYALYELTRRTNWLAIVFLLILVPVAHYAAVAAFLWLSSSAIEAAQTGSGATSPLLPGLLAGFAGSALSFLALFVLGLRSAKAGLVAFIAGIVLLTAWGGISMLLLPSGEQMENPTALTFILPIFLPWQLIFGFFLSALLRPSPKRGEVATTDSAGD